jgi:hypothetical protein
MVSGSDNSRMGAAARGESAGRYFYGDKINGEYCWYRDNSGGKLTQCVQENRIMPVYMI